MQLYFEMRILRQEAHDRRRHMLTPEHCRSGDGEQAARRGVKCRQTVSRFGQFGEKIAGAGQKILPRIGQRQPAGTADEQSGLKVRLQKLHPPRDRGHCHALRFGHTGKTAGGCHRQKGRNGFKHAGSFFANIAKVTCNLADCSTTRKRRYGLVQTAIRRWKEIQMNHKSTKLTLSALVMASLGLAAMATTAAYAGAPMLKTLAPGYYRTMVGAFEVTAISDGTVALPVDQLLTNTTPQAVDAELAAAFETSPLETSDN